MTRHSNESILSSRRALLKAAGGCAMMTNTSLISTLLNLQATKAMAADIDPGGYKAIVCLFLFGGNDSYNMVIPAGGDATSGEYGDYHSVRGGYDDGTNNPGGLAINQPDLIPITGPNGRPFGFHPGMASQVEDNAGEIVTTNNGGAAQLYNDGKLSVIANVGSLLERTTRATYNARADLPLGLFSHADLQRHWMTGVPQSRSQVTGWGGRLADCLDASNLNESVSMNISLGGMNLFQSGGGVVPYAIGSNGATIVNGYSNDLGDLGRQNRMQARAFDSILGQTYSDLLARSFAEQSRNAIDAAIEFNTAVGDVDLNTPFANETPSNQLKMVARVIGAQSQLRQSRQVFFVTLGGWDMHANLITGQETRLPIVSRAIKSFYDATVELELENDVVLFTASDFARTLYTNGQGSDHGWGGNHLICGGGIKGGQFFGEFPSTLDNPTYDADPSYGNLDVGRGRIIPTTAVDEYAADLAMWFGIPNNEELETVIPNIRRFYDAAEADPPLGLFA